MSEFVSTFPPPPQYYQQFASSSKALAPPAAIALENKEIYGGSMLLPDSQDQYNPNCDYRKELKRY